MALATARTFGTCDANLARLLASMLGVQLHLVVLARVGIEVGHIIDAADKARDGPSLLASAMMAGAANPDRVSSGGHCPDVGNRRFATRTVPIKRAEASIAANSGPHAAPRNQRARSGVHA